MRGPRDATPSENYPRPQQAWQCGLSDDGPPCALGPSGWGRCPASAACHPVRDGERWRCNRSAVRGGTCAEGPGHDGACHVVLQCSPVRSLRIRRGRFVAGCFVAAIGAACMALSGSWRNELIAPGPLSVHHAHLVDGANASMRCAQCHAAGNATLVGWAEMSAGSAPAAASQSDLCMACHDKLFAREFATMAHSMPLQALRNAMAATEGASVSAALRDPAEPIACSACHREHQGRNHDLAAISDAACQACHQARFHSFADGHPDFGSWPYERPTGIVFDHASHQQKHHPAAKRAFDCAACHEADATGAWQLTQSYAASCAECHDKSLVLSLADGVPFVSLPTLDVAALTAAGHDLVTWPKEATGDFDGAAPILAKLLMSATPQAAEALAMLGPNFTYFDVNPDDKAQVAAAAVVAAELKALLDDLAARGQPALAERIAVVLGREPSAQEVDALAARLSPATLAAYRDRWFGGAAVMPGDGGGENWRRDDATLSLRYQPAGHADPWLHAWLDALAESASGPRAVVAEPLLRAALKPNAPGQCGSCHSVERDVSGRFTIQWRPFEPNREMSGLTHFAHAAHVLQSELRDCTACHRVKSEAAATAVATVAGDAKQYIAQFEPMTKLSCVACHTAGAAGNSCTQCHAYHEGVGGRQRAVGSGE